jgi:3-phosphoshikimate 1-carboxyvinyltransferase
VAKKSIGPARKIDGAIEVPGDKSISHRYAILAALAEGPSEIRNYSTAQDCASTLDCLRRLGLKIDSSNGVVKIQGVGLHGLHPSRRALDAGNSGTTMRLLAGVLAGQPFVSALTGDSSLRRRPMNRVIEPLTQMGARIHARDEKFAPLEIHGGNLLAIHYVLPVPSAQVKSAVLLAGLSASGTTSVEEPVRTRDHTEIALREFGAKLDQVGRKISVHGGAAAKLRGRSLTVPGDLSAAIFFIAAALILPESQLLIRGVGLNPTRSAVLDFLISIGAPIRLVSIQLRDGELVGDIIVRHASLTGGVISGPAVAEMIDELPMLAALGPFTEKGIEIRDAQELRVKESDRIATLATNLKKMGAQVEEFPDGLRVAGRSAGPLRGATIEPAADHRIAMAFAIAALGATGRTTIRDSDCVAVSFPDFFTTLARVAER